MAKPVHAAIEERWLHCLVCGGDRFREREMKLNSTGMELFNFGWANESATALVCWRCGYVHTFANENIELYRAEK